MVDGETKTQYMVIERTALPFQKGDRVYVMDGLYGKAMLPVEKTAPEQKK